jgi:hypothetical protein
MTGERELDGDSRPPRVTNAACGLHRLAPGETDTPIMDNRARPPLEGERAVMLNRTTSRAR